MSGKPSETVIRAWARLLRAQRLALAEVETALKNAGLPPLTWYDALLEIERAGDDGVRPFELERAMLLAQYNLSRLLDRVEHEGYIAREACPDDGRGRIVHITEKGKAMRRKMWPVYARAIETVVGRSLNSEQLAALDGALGSLIDGLT